MLIGITAIQKDSELSQLSKEVFIKHECLFSHTLEVHAEISTDITHVRGEKLIYQV